MDIDFMWVGISEVYEEDDEDDEIIEEEEITQVESGQSFLIGDYGRYHNLDTGEYGVATLFDVTYRSDNEEIAIVDKRGMVTTKNIGFVRIFMECEEERCPCMIEVVEKGRFGTSDCIKRAKEALDELLSSMPEEITEKTIFAALQADKKYERIIYDECYEEIEHSGFLMEQDEDGSPVKSNKLAIPQAGRSIYYGGLLNKFKEKHIEFNIKNKNYIKVKSVSATEDEVIIELSEEITEEQMIASQIYQAQTESMYTSLQEEEAILRLHLFDITLKADELEYVEDDLLDDIENVEEYGEEDDKEECIACLASIQKGSCFIKAIPVRFEYGELPLVTTTRTKLQKGHTYRLGEEEQWTKGMKFMVK